MIIIRPLTDMVLNLWLQRRFVPFYTVVLRARKELLFWKRCVLVTVNWFGWVEDEGPPCDQCERFQNI